MSKTDPIYKGDFGAVDCNCDILDKKVSVRKYVTQMLNRTNEMFEWKGLPDTIPQYMLELYLQLNGQVAVTKVGENLYALPGGLGGAPDPYYRPTLYVLANPGLNYSASLKILNHLDPFNKDQASTGECVLIKNDTLMEGMLYTYSRYAVQLTENDISIRSAQINARAHVNIEADTDKDAAAAKKYVESLEAGKIEIVTGTPFMESVKVQNLSMNSANVIIQLIELQQYLKASWYNEIGLNANFNMKREYQSEEELQANTDVLLPLVDDMLANRKSAVEFINKIYGTSISVEKNSSWENKQFERETEKEMKKNEAESAGESDV